MAYNITANFILFFSQILPLDTAYFVGFGDIAENKIDKKTFPFVASIIVSKNKQTNKHTKLKKGCVGT
jgi:hypothetical protein